MGLALPGFLFFNFIFSLLCWNGLLFGRIGLFRRFGVNSLRTFRPYTNHGGDGEVFLTGHFHDKVTCHLRTFPSGLVIVSKKLNKKEKKQTLQGKSHFDKVNRSFLQLLILL